MAPPGSRHTIPRVGWWNVRVAWGRWFVGAAALILSVGCPEPTPPPSDDEPTESPRVATPGHSLSSPPSGPAGSSCAGRDDCPSDQVCVDARCRYRHTSRAGEVLAAGASAQMEAGDLSGALQTYDSALEAYQASSAPVPPEVLCAAALCALGIADAETTRERAATRADRCFRSSLPGSESRTEVEAALARLRFDGLDLALFDQEEPADRFFTQEPTRPTVDAIEIALDLEERDSPGYAQLTEGLRSEESRRAIADCFVQDWEINHERTAEASLVLKFQTRLRDMGDYDSFLPSTEVVQTGVVQEGFEPCVATALTASLSPGPRVARSVSAWQVPFNVAVSLQ